MDPVNNTQLLYASKGSIIIAVITLKRLEIGYDLNESGVIL